MEQLPLVSVIMPAFNAEQFIETAISSVLQQTYTNWELIVVDDGSTDSTASKVQALAAEEKRIMYLFQPNGKQGKARNTGIRRASGAYIAFLDADDCWMRDKLEMQLYLLKQHGAQVAFGDIMIIDAAGRAVSGTWGVREASFSGEAGLIAFLENNRVPLLAAIAEKSAIETVGGFRESTEVQYGEDYSLWLRLLQQGALFVSTAAIVGAYRIHGAQATRNVAGMLQVIATISSLDVSAPAVKAAQRMALKKWIRRFLKSVSSPDRLALQQIINVYPGKLQAIFSLLQYCVPGPFLGRLIAFCCRPQYYSPK